MTLFTAIPVIDGMPEVVDLLHLRMEARALRAEFSFGGDDPRRLAVTFSAVAVLRALDDAIGAPSTTSPARASPNITLRMKWMALVFGGLSPRSSPTSVAVGSRSAITPF